MSQSAAPSIQILDRDNYSKQHIVTLPSTTFPPLGPSSLRIKSDILGLTTNNFAYALLGHILGWWDVYPIPSDTPAPFNDASKYGRIGAWGYATIMASTVPSIPVGKTIFGFLPIGTLPVDVNIRVTEFDDTQIEVLDPHRQHLWKIYNRYHICEPLEDLIAAKGEDYLAWDALMQALFGSSYNLSRYGFAWDEENLIHPGGNLDESWTMQDADLKGAVVISLSGSGKTATSFAHQLKRNRPEGERPAAVVGVCSEKSRGFTDKTGFYDDVVLYSDDAATLIKAKYPDAKKIVLVDFGARGGVEARWIESMKTLDIPLRQIRIAGEAKPLTAAEATEFIKRLSEAVVVSASALREKGIEKGGKAYFEEFYKAYDSFKEDGGIPGTTFQWGTGMQDWEKQWNALTKDEVDVGKALVFRV